MVIGYLGRLVRFFMMRGFLSSPRYTGDIKGLPTLSKNFSRGTFLAREGVRFLVSPCMCVLLYLLRETRETETRARETRKPQYTHIQGETRKRGPQGTSSHLRGSMSDSGTRTIRTRRNL
jgi:hypothetical protein